LGGKLLYIDMQASRPLEDKRTEPTLKVSNSYAPGAARSGPGRNQTVEAEFP